MNRLRTQSLHHTTHSRAGSTAYAAYDVTPPTHLPGEGRSRPGARARLAVVVVMALLVVGAGSYAAGYAQGAELGALVERGEPEPPGTAAREAARAVAVAVPVGEPGRVAGFEVVVAGVDCAPTLPGTVDNPDWDGSPRTPRRVRVRAPEGKVLCVVSSRWTSTSDEPAFLMPWEAFRTLVTSTGQRFAATGDDPAWSRVLSERAGQEEWTLNPGDAAQLRTVLTLPDGSEVTHAVVEPLRADEETWFATR